MGRGAYRQPVARGALRSAGRAVGPWRGGPRPTADDQPARPSGSCCEARTRTGQGPAPLRLAGPSKQRLWRRLLIGHEPGRGEGGVDDEAHQRRPSSIQVLMSSGVVLGRPAREAMMPAITAATSPSRRMRVSLAIGSLPRWMRTSYGTDEADGEPRRPR